MKQNEVLQLANTINLLDGKGSTRLKWAVYRTARKLEKEQKDAVEFLDSLKSEELKTLQKEHAELMQKHSDEKERILAYQNWSRKGDYEKALHEFITSKKYVDFLESENEEFIPYDITLQLEDMEGVELNNQIFWILERITTGLDTLMEGKEV